MRVKRTAYLVPEGNVALSVVDDVAEFPCRAYVTLPVNMDSARRTIVHEVVLQRVHSLDACARGESAKRAYSEGSHWTRSVISSSSLRSLRVRTVSSMALPRMVGRRWPMVA
jgi:hypothetical protein